MALSRLRSSTRRLPFSSPVALVIRRLAAYWAFRDEFNQFVQMSGHSTQRFELAWREHKAYLADRTSNTDFDRHYVYHTAWAARILAKVQPSVHIDISSTLYFVGIVSAFMPVKFFDYRPAHLELSNLDCGHADLLALPFPDGSLLSISCMHVVEHVGLGRYGDSLNPDADRKAMSELQRVLAPGGTLLFVVPVGRPRLVFNAHRIYAFGQIMKEFPELELKEFTLVPDDPRKGLVVHASGALADSQQYGCGCFWYRRTV